MSARSSKQFFWMFFLDAIVTAQYNATLQWHHTKLVVTRVMGPSNATTSTAPCNGTLVPRPIPPYWKSEPLWLSLSGEKCLSSLTRKALDYHQFILETPLVKHGASTTDVGSDNPTHSDCTPLLEAQPL